MDGSEQLLPFVAEPCGVLRNVTNGARLATLDGAARGSATADDGLASWLTEYRWSTPQGAGAPLSSLDADASTASPTVTPAFFDYLDTAATPRAGAAALAVDADARELYHTCDGMAAGNASKPGICSSTPVAITATR